jgi:predicted RNase H-like HicB family nuclease
MARPIVIHADWDADAGVWVATSQDVRGLVTEADTIETLRAKLPGMILDLLEENGNFDRPASIEIIARASDPLSVGSQLTDEQVSEVELAKQEVRAGKIATDAEMEAVWRRFGR